MLHEMINYAQTAGLRSEPGFGPRWVRWLVVFRPDGTFHEIIDLKGDDKKSKGREFPVCPVLTFSDLISHKLRHFLIDSVDKFCLLTKAEPIDKELRDHASFVSLLRTASAQWLELEPIVASLESDAGKQAIRESLVAAKAKPIDTATIAILDGTQHRILVKESSWHDWWRQFRASLGVEADDESAPSKSKKKPKAATTMRCFISGELVEPAATQDKIRGLSDVGGLPVGDVLSSFDKEAFNHFGLSQGQNAAIGVTEIKAATDALNHLIQERGQKLASSKVVYWYSQPVPIDPVEDIFGGAAGENLDGPQDSEPTDQERYAAEDTARKLLTSIRSGQRPELADCQFYALTLSGNSGRVVIRDWMQGRFDDLLEAVIAWFDDLAIVSRDGKQTIRSHKFLAVLGASVRDLKDVPSPAVATLWRCALNKNQPIPKSLLAQTLARVRIDVTRGDSPRHARLGLLRAFCVRSSHSQVPKMTAELDNSIDDPAYLCGRIMAVLAAIQEKALPDVGAGVVQRYYAAASATPALVLGRLVRTAQIAHLPKINQEAPRLRHWFEGQLSELWTRMQQTPPTTLSLEGQTLFAMGFYQQKAERYKKKEGGETASTDAQ